MYIFLLQGFFARLDVVTKTLEQHQKPTGLLKEFPAMTCRDIKLDHPTFKNGKNDYTVELNICSSNKNKKYIIDRKSVV